MIPQPIHHSKMPGPTFVTYSAWRGRTQRHSTKTSNNWCCCSCCYHTWPVRRPMPSNCRLRRKEGSCCSMGANASIKMGQGRADMVMILQRLLRSTAAASSSENPPPPRAHTHTCTHEKVKCTRLQKCLTCSHVLTLKHNIIHTSIQVHAPERQRTTAHPRLREYASSFGMVTLTIPTRSLRRVMAFLRMRLTPVRS